MLGLAGKAQRSKKCSQLTNPASSHTSARQQHPLPHHRAALLQKQHQNCCQARGAEVWGPALQETAWPEPIASARARHFSQSPSRHR